MMREADIRLLSALVLAGLLLAAALGLLPEGQVQAQSGSGRQMTVLASAQRTADTNSSTISNLGENLNVRGAYVILDVTGALTTPLITPSIQARDPASGNYYNLLVASSGVSTIGTYVYLVYAGAITRAGVTQLSELPLPQAWRVSVDHNDTDPITYSVGAMVAP